MPAPVTPPSLPYPPYQQYPPGYTPEEPTLDVRDYLRPIWQRKWLILAITLIAIGGSYVIASRHTSGPTTRQYAASTEVYIEVADPVELIGSSGAPNPPDGQQMSDMATLLTDQANTAAVYKHLAIPVGSAGSVTAQLLSTGSAATFGTSIIVVQSTSPSPKLAASLANTYVSAFLASRKRSEAAAATADANADRAQLDSLAANATNAAARRALLLQISQYSAIARNPDAGAYQISTATPPGGPLPVSRTTHRPIVDALIGGLIGLLLSIGLAFALNLFDRRLLRVSAVEARYGRSVLAVLPRVSKPTRTVGSRAVVPGQFIENLRSLRINLRLLGASGSSRTLVVTSAVPGEGKSTVAGNLALVCCESGERVLLIDADLRRPSIATRFGLEGQIGLAHVLRGESSLGDAVTTVRHAQPTDPNQNGGGDPHAAHAIDPRSRGVLDVLVHGDLLDDPVSLLGSRGMEATLEAATRRYDLVIVDTAPLLAVADTVPILSVVDAVLLVARLGRTTRDHAERLLEVLARVPEANVAGVVANDLRGPVLDGGYGGLYKGGRDGYGYGHRNGNGNGARPQADAPGGPAERAKT